MENMPIKKLAERSTFSCNQKFDKFLEKKNINMTFTIPQCNRVKVLRNSYVHLYQEEICCQLKVHI